MPILQVRVHHSSMSRVMVAAAVKPTAFSNVITVADLSMNKPLRGTKTSARRYLVRNVEFSIRLISDSSTSNKRDYRDKESRWTSRSSGPKHQHLFLSGRLSLTS